MHKYFFDEDMPDSYYIRSDYTGDFVGTVYRHRQRSQSKFLVTNPIGEEIALVDTVDEAIPVITNYLERARWRRDADELVGVGAAAALVAAAPVRRGLRYAKETQYGMLWVDEVTHGRWVAYRNDYELLSDDKIAEFGTREEAQRTADAHLHDGYSISQVIKDGYSWLPDVDCPKPRKPKTKRSRATRHAVRKQR